jgi:hypothetical protein
MSIIGISLACLVTSACAIDKTPEEESISHYPGETAGLPQGSGETSTGKSPCSALPGLFLLSLVATVTRVAMIDPCCGADYHGQNHRQRDARNRQGYVWIGRKRVRWTVLYLDHWR